MWQPLASLHKTVSRIFPRKPANPAATVGEPESVPAITLLCIFPSTADRDLLHQLSARNSWGVIFASSRDEARDALRNVQPQIILLDREADLADWRYTVSSLSAASNGACVLLVSRVADEYLWNDVVSNGGYDVVRRPLSEEDLLRNVRLAWSYWNATRGINAAATK